MKYILIIIILAGITGFITNCGNTIDQPPNIVFFFVDDMGWQDTSEPFHTDTTELNRRYFTPNIENPQICGIKIASE